MNDLYRETEFHSFLQKTNYKQCSVYQKFRCRENVNAIYLIVTKAWDTLALRSLSVIAEQEMFSQTSKREGLNEGNRGRSTA